MTRLLRTAATIIPSLVLVSLGAIMGAAAQAPCTTPADCDDGNACTSDLCLPDSSCQHAPVNGACDDGNACTALDWCAFGTCVGEQPVTCPEDDNPCTYADCVPSSGCSQQPLPDGLACDDANACTAGDSCLFGACVGGAAEGCDDGDPCTVDGCDPLGGCEHTPVTTCEDGNACTTNDTCVDGVCSGGPPPDCDDGSSCTDDSCYPAAGCVNALNHTCDGEPVGLGYWKRLCRGPVEGERLTAVDVACVSTSCTFSSVASLADLCERLHANPPQDHCELAEAHLMALLLNACRGRVTDSLAIRSRCWGPDHATVGASRAEADGLLCEPPLDGWSCDTAACLAEEINSGWVLR